MVIDYSKLKLSCMVSNLTGNCGMKQITGVTIWNGSAQISTTDPALYPMLVEVVGSDWFASELRKFTDSGGDARNAFKGDRGYFLSARFSTDVVIGTAAVMRALIDCGKHTIVCTPLHVNNAHTDYGAMDSFIMGMYLLLDGGQSLLSRQIFTRRGKPADNVHSGYAGWKDTQKTAFGRMSENAEKVLGIKVEATWEPPVTEESKDVAPAEATSAKPARKRTRKRAVVPEVQGGLDW